MKKFHPSHFIFLFIIILFFMPKLIFAQASYVEIPVGYNSYINGDEFTRLKFDKLINYDSGSEGIKNWDDARAKFSVWFKTTSCGKLNLTLKLQSDSHSLIRVSVPQCDFSETLELDKSLPWRYDFIQVGEINIKSPGYIHVDIEGLAKFEDHFCDISSLLLSGEVTRSPIYFADISSDGLFARRGPYLTLAYQMPKKKADENFDAFYSEVTVPDSLPVMNQYPKGYQDAPGSYYGVCSIDKSYLGIERTWENPGKDTRSVIFAVWDSPFGDSTVLVKQPENVRCIRFEGEGTGIRCLWEGEALWRTGKKYACLLKVTPDGNGNTLFDASFRDDSGWHFMGEMRYSDHLTAGTHWIDKSYSFLESFLPEWGDVFRSAYYGNQWLSTDKGNWYKITAADFIPDGNGYRTGRKDFLGNVAADSIRIYLQSGGFDQDSLINQDMEFAKQKHRIYLKTDSSISHPSIDWNQVFVQ